MTFANATAYVWDRLSEFTDGTYSMDKKVTLKGSSLALKGFPTSNNEYATVLQASNNATQRCMVTPFCSS